MKSKKNPPRLKVSELKEDRTYILCPDRSCDLFWTKPGKTPCEADCPKQEQVVKIIPCFVCKEMIELPGDHHYWSGIDHKCKSYRLRTSTNYEILYEKPEQD